MTRADVEKELARCRLLEQAESHCASRDFIRGYMSAVRDLRDPQTQKVIEQFNAAFKAEKGKNDSRRN